MSRRRVATVRRLERAVGRLATDAIQRMDEALPWYRAMPPEERSWVGLVAQAGIAAFLEWFRRPGTQLAITADVFGTAPRELARAVSLQQTVEMIRLTIAVVEEQVDELAAPGEEQLLRECVLRYSREIAFAAAQVYAQAAEARGAWDARLEALVVDAVLRGEVDEGIRSRASALGWGQQGGVAVVVGLVRDDPPDLVADGVQRCARSAGLDVISAVQGDLLAVAADGVADPLGVATALAGQFAPGPVVVGPVVADLTAAAGSAEEAMAGLRAAAAWPGAPRPVTAEALLPERALDGDRRARDQLVSRGYATLQAAGGDLLETLAALGEGSGSIEGAARTLFVHPNTVRYRLRRVVDLTGFVPTDPRDAFALRLAGALGRLADAAAAL
ncbi:MAG: helix-turn-helix domain-containing protein [Actinomycetia bacterium]|jgi:DNA-binding PucR family transcriptional regulator|nr:helix-turn-helix domain-containing protein [Actinomycetes bacterium]